MALNINGTTGISGVDGSASAPALTGTDSNTGINFGSDILGFNTGGVERSRFDASGRLLIGTTTEGTGAADDLTIETSGSTGITVRSGTSSDGSLFFSDGTSGTDEYRGYIQYGHASNIMLFGTDATERMRIDNDGRLNFNRTSQISAGLINIEYDRNTFWGMAFTKNSGLGTNIAFTNNSLTVVGSISSTDSATSYNTSSDYRLKENAVAISDGITRIKTLKPYKFNWIADETNTPVDGFFAHEVSDAVPEAITGIKDQVATNDDKGYTKGDPIYQQIDQSKLVPLLTAALQEAIAKIETLETENTQMKTDLTALTTRVTALEAK